MRSLFLLLGIVSAALLPAQPSVPDTVSRQLHCTMTNGDRLSGRLISFRDDRLTIIARYTGRAVLSRDDIAFCQTPDTLIQRDIATLLLPKDPLAIAMPLPVQQITAPPPPPPPPSTPRIAILRPAMSVVQPNTPIPFIRERLGWGRVMNVNYAYSSGNASVADVSLTGAVVRIQQRNRFALQGSVRRAHRDGVSTAQSLRTLLRYDWAIGKIPERGSAPSIFDEVGYEHDRLAKLDTRLLTNMGISLPFFSTPTRELALDLGLGTSHEQYTTGVDRTKGGAVVRITSRQRLVGHTMSTQQVTALPDLDRSGRYRLNGDASIAAPLSRSLSLRVTVNNRYDTRPQYAVKKNDFTVQSGVGIEF